MNDKFYGLLGLAQRARALVSGGMACEQTLKKGKACLIVLAKDAAAEVKEQYTFFANKHRVPLITVDSKAALGVAIGKSPRVAVIVTEPNFCRRLQELCTRDNGGGQDVQNQSF